MADVEKVIEGLENIKRYGIVGRPMHVKIDNAIQTIRGLQEQNNKYMEFEEKLKSVYGYNDSLLETVVNGLVKYENDNDRKSFKARLLTNEDVDLWEKLKEQNKWHLCSEGLPKEHESMFAKYKGTDKWNPAMFEKISDEVNVVIQDKNGKKVVTHAHTVDGQWKSDLLDLNKSYEVIAWMELPKFESEG